MSDQLLLELRDSRAFDQSPSAGQLAELHVPFDDLAAQSSRPYEGLLIAALRRGERVALIGASGSGKSSITEFVLTQPELRRFVAPMWIRVGMQTDELSMNPAAFAALIVTEIARQIEQTRRVRKIDRAVRGGSSRPKKFTLGGGIPMLNAQLSGELGGLIEEPARGEDAAHKAVELLRLIESAGVQPTLILDDTDRWIRRPGIDNPDARIAWFFGQVLQFIADRLANTAAVVAVHTDYLANPHYENAKEFMGSRIKLPQLDRADALGEVIHRRIVVSGHQVDVHDVITPAALAKLFEYYEQTGGLRRSIAVLHGALARACDGGTGLVDVNHVAAEIAAV